MWRLFGLIAPLLIFSGAAAAAGAFMPAGPPKSNVLQTTTQYTPQMLQCDSPDPDRAIIGCDAVINSNATPDIKSIAYGRRGVAYERRGDYDRAIADLNAAVRIDPKSVNALRVRGNYYRDQHDFEHALENYNQAIAVNPKDPETFTQRANAYVINGNFVNAMADYGQAIALNPKSAMAYTSRGEAYRSHGEDDRAIADFDQAIKLEPKLVNAFIRRGLAQENKNDYTRAIADFTQAIKVDPKNVTAYDERASASSTRARMTALSPISLRRSSSIRKIRMHIACNDRPVSRAGARSGVRLLFQRHEIGDDVVHVAWVGEPGKRHAIALHLGLRVGEILPQVSLIPGEICALHRG